MKLKNKCTSLFQGGGRRTLLGKQFILFNVMAIILAVFQIWSVIWGKLNPINQMAIHLALILALTFISPVKKSNCTRNFIALCRI
ncbi:hypothetical protein GCM10008983_27500 [Lentibacillus halophilus]|uniref:Uncharacterized protein n=1 Tax=Lentibacillus halophilus TaxID=295065 RepID=A0ABN0ZIA9_9BACI